MYELVVFDWLEHKDSTKTQATGCVCRRRIQLASKLKVLAEDVTKFEI